MCRQYGARARGSNDINADAEQTQAKCSNWVIGEVFSGCVREMFGRIVSVAPMSKERKAVTFANLLTAAPSLSYLNDSIHLAPRDCGPCASRPGQGRSECSKWSGRNRIRSVGLPRDCRPGRV